MKELSVFQKDKIILEVVDYIEKNKLTCGDDVIFYDGASIEAKYIMAELVDIALKTQPENDSYKGIQEH